MNLYRVCKQFFSSNEGYMNQDSTNQIFERILFYIIVFEVKNQMNVFIYYFWRLILIYEI